MKEKEMLKEAVEAQKETLNFAEDLFAGTLDESDAETLEEVFGVGDPDEARDEFWASILGAYAEVGLTGGRHINRVRLVLATGGPHIELALNEGGHGEIVGYWAGSDPVRERVYFPSLADAVFEWARGALGGE